MKDNKPTVGSLVRLREVADLVDAEIALYWDRKDKVGLVTKCQGIRCTILWSDGEYSIPERSLLEVLSS